LVSGLMYYYWGAVSERGNNLLLEEYHRPEQTIPLRMAPLVLIGTVITHLFGGSAGREGSAVQMGGAAPVTAAPPIDPSTARCPRKPAQVALLHSTSAAAEAAVATPAHHTRVDL